MTDPTDRQRRIAAYHDGEPDVDPQRRSRDAPADDEAARRELASLRRLSEAIAGAPRPTLPPGVLAAIHDAVEREATETVLYRLGRRLTTAAAAILVMASVGLSLAGGESAANGDDVIAEALLAMETPATEARDPDAAVSAWILRSLGETPTPPDDAGEAVGR